jgi:succinate dehydrogenase hydrophobic anchor subunit
MALQARGRSADPREELARWMGARQKCHSEYVKLLNERKNEILSLEIDHGPRSEAYASALHEYERHDQQFDRLQAVVRRPINNLSIAPWVFWLLAVGLAILEAPVNKFLFDYAIQGSNLTSYLVSTAFAILLLLLAHLCGKCLRQIWSEYRRRVVWHNLIIALLAICVLAILVSILTIGRARYSAGAADPGIGGLFSDIGGQVSQHGFLSSLLYAFTDVSALILFTVNFGGIVIAMLLGFFSHDPDKDFDHAEIALRKATRRLSKIQGKYAQSRVKAIRKFTPDLSGASRNFADANNKIIEMKTLLNHPLDEWDQFVLDNLDTLADEAEAADVGSQLAGSRLPPSEVTKNANIRPLR